MKSPTTFKTSLLLAVALLWAGTAGAGLYVEQKVTSGGQGEGMDMDVRAWAEEGMLRVEYVDSNNELLPEGSYLLTRDGGQTVYLVRPAEQTYSVFSLEQIFGMLGQMQEMSGGIVDIDFKDPFSEAVEESPGGTILGHSTTRKQWRSGYTMDLKVAFMDQSNRVVTDTDAWIAPAIDDPALRVWFGAVPPGTGDPELDAVLRSGMDVYDGMVLKLEQTTTTTNKKGRQTSSTTVMEVTELRQESPDPALFVMPENFTETPLIPEMAGMEADQGEEEGPMKALKGMFGRKKKNKDN